MYAHCQGLLIFLLREHVISEVWGSQIDKYKEQVFPGFWGGGCHRDSVVGLLSKPTTDGGSLEAYRFEPDMGLQLFSVTDCKQILHSLTGRTGLGWA